METIEEIEALFDRLWPINRSITGEGVRRTHDILSEVVPLQRQEIPSGTPVLDWIVPKEWVVREAYIVDPAGKRILDVNENNLHLVGYSVPFHGVLSKEELQAHLHSRPELPEAIPYVTSYYTSRWGFCLPHRMRESLPGGDYRVVVDTDLVDGALTLGTTCLSKPGAQEVLISTNTCHPSMANNELSGPLVAAYLWRRVSQWPVRNLGYRFIFGPETIGSLAYLAQHGTELRKNLAAGFVVTCVGDAAPFTLKRSRLGSTLADRAAELILGKHDDASLLDFFPHGADERQYCSPGFDLPVASVMRSPYGTYPEYHTSLDNKDFISFPAMRESIDVYEQILRVIDRNAHYVNLSPYGEPHLGSRGLYPSIGTLSLSSETEAIMWLLSYSDGNHDLIHIAKRSGLGVEVLADAADRLEAADLLRRVEDADG